MVRLRQSFEKSGGGSVPPPGRSDSPMNDTQQLNLQTNEVSLKGTPGNADATPTLNIIFATLCFCFWANGIGLLGEGATLAIGILQLAFFGGYLVGAIILISRANAFGGNTFLIFASFFGAAGGLTHIGMVIAEKLGLPFDYRVLGIAFIVAGVFLLAMLPGLLSAPKLDFLCFLTGGLGVLGFGLTGAGLLGAQWNPVAGWLLFVDGVLAMYAVAANMLGYMGIKLSCGKPFVSPKQ